LRHGATRPEPLLTTHEESRLRAYASSEHRDALSTRRASGRRSGMYNSCPVRSTGLRNCRTAPAFDIC
jgi:hypothetical protein